MKLAIVIPTIGRPSLAALLDSLGAATGPLPDRIVLVDDRRIPSAPLDVAIPQRLMSLVKIRTSGGRGPAAARNAGWRAVDAEWIAFLDDDVRVSSDWLQRLADDLASLDAEVAASSGRIEVPLPPDRRPTDWERTTAGLATAQWITADIACRRHVLDELRGFDERFRRAFREDADLALRVQNRGWRLTRGQRVTVHPVRPARWDVSVRAQRGNADDALMTALHGRKWYERAGAPVGRRPWHIATTAALVGGVVGKQRIGWSVWAGLTALFAAQRILPGPRTVPEIARTTATSVLIPPLATAYTIAGRLRWRNVPQWQDIPAAVLFDRDGTLIHDVAYNGNPDRVAAVVGARTALRQLRAAGVRLGVVTNQSGVARGLITEGDVARVNARVEELLGPFDTWQHCPHGEADDCACRKPRPGLVHAAAAALGVRPEHCVVVGDTGSDVAAAQAAGARAVLVPNDATRVEEVASAPVVCASVAESVRRILAAEVPA